VSQAGPQLALQAAWVVALALFTRLLWRRAARRVISQGG
jgi:ABC-2 type transport system permease protein